MRPPEGSRGIDELLAGARARLDRLSPERARRAQRDGALLVDIRPVEQRRAAGQIPGALVIGRNVLEWRLDPRSDARLEVADRYDRPVVIVCQQGYASSLVAASLRDLGLYRATDLDGGFEAWAAAGLPVTPGPTESYRGRRRYRPGEDAAARKPERSVIASNRRARHDYTVLKTYEAGIALLGTEVKALRAGRASLADAFAQERDGELLLYGLHIGEYAHGGWTNHQPRRTRKLLLHRVEIDRILARVREGGVTLVPLSMYFADGWAKVELALARGRRAYDKRHVLAERDAQREIARQLGRHLKGMPRG